MPELTIPTLRGGRLILRGFRADDFEAYAAIRLDPEVGRFIGGTITREQAWGFMAIMLGQWSLRGYGVFAIEEAATGDLVGHCGILHPIDWPEPEIAYTVSPAKWGKGFAPEAARAVRDWAYEAYGFPRLVSYIDPANARSIRVAEKVEAKRGPEVTLRGHIVHAWVHAA